MSAHEKIHPWEFVDFTEAIENASELKRKLMFCAIATAVNLDLKNDHANHLAMVSIRQLIDDYWEEAEKLKLERNCHD